MARAKRASDERYNARRRARRELARIERALESGTLTQEQRATQMGYAARLTQAIEQSYVANRVRGIAKSARAKLVSAADAALRRAQSVIESRRLSLAENGVANRVFAAKIRSAQAGLRTDVAGLDKVRAQFFYVATKRLWQGYPLRERNDRIMSGLGVDSLEEAYRIVIRANRQRIADYRDMLAGLTPEYSVQGWTDQAAEFYNDAPMMEEDTRMTSPLDVVYF